MATIGNTYMTLADKFRRMGAQGEGVADVIEILTEINPILDDAIAVECNDGSSHLTTVRTGLPQGTWRKLYQGVQPSKSTTKQVKDTTGWLEAYSEVDKKLVDLAGPNGAALRLSEATAFLDGMANQMATALFYSDDAANPEQFMGLSPRFDDLSAENANQIVDVGGTGSDNTSIWFITWGPMHTTLLYPKGSMAGVQRKDLGEQTKENSDGSLYQVMREHFQWDMGLSVRDWRYLARVCNIDVSEMRASGTSNSIDVENYMIDAYYKLKTRRPGRGEMAGRLAIYCNSEVKAALHKRARDKANVNLTIENFEGREIVRFLGAPIQEVDALLLTEARVT